VKAKLTQCFVEDLPAPDPSGQQQYYWDTELRGFGVLVSGTSNVKSYVVQGSVEGSKRRIVIGRTNILSMDEAQESARRVLADFRGPIVLKKVARATTKRAAARAVTKSEERKVIALYRHYDEHEQLLYIGKSVYPLIRQHSHLKHANWRNEIRRIALEPFTTEEELAAAERDAIQTEKPRYNVAYNRGGVVYNGQDGLPDDDAIRWAKQCADRIVADRKNIGNRLLTAERLAELLGVSTKALKKLQTKDHGPPFTKLGPRTTRYVQSSVLEWLTEQESDDEPWTNR
jgi:predicted DNA-binding transcriptional regulator AlpA